MVTKAPAKATGGKRNVRGEAPLKAAKEPTDGASTPATGEAEDVLNIKPSAAGTVFVPPRVTLTIEFGTLSSETIGAVSNFVQAALSASPANALGIAGGARLGTGGDRQVHRVGTEAPTQKGPGGAPAADKPAGKKPARRPPAKKAAAAK